MRVLIMPIVYIALQVLNMSVCVYFVIGLVTTGSYDIQNGIFELKKVDNNMEEHGMPLEITACVFMILMGLFMYCLIVSSFQFMVSSLTFQWYNDRISLQFKQKEKKTTGDSAAKSSGRFGSHHTFRIMLRNYVRQFGSLCCYSAMSILLILPHAMCWIILEVDQRFSENKIV